MDVPQAISREEAGRAVTRPRPRRLPALVVGIARAFLADDGLTWSSAMAFYLVLSLPPLLVALAAILHALVPDDEVGRLLDQISQVVPAEGPLVKQLAVSHGREIQVAGLLAVVWLLVSGSRVTGVVVSAIEGMWEVPRSGTFVERQVLRFVVLGLGGLLLLIGSVATSWLGPVVAGLGDGGALVWLVGLQVFPLLLVVGALTLLYRTVPPGRASVRPAVAGALVATVILRLAEFAFTEIIRFSSGWQTLYGPLAGVALVLTWALVASAAVIIGAEVVIVLVRPERLERVGRGKPGQENRDPAARDRAAAGD